MFRLFSLLIGYALGTIQTSYFVGKLHGIDIRDFGSKNAGMTNVTRTLGKKVGAFVFIIDILKGAAAFIAATLIFGGEGTFFSYNCEYVYACALPGVLPGIYAGLGAILGHCFPFFLKFRGGKGVSCTLGLIFMIDWRVAVFAYVLGIIAVAVWRYISLASLVITLIVPVAMAFAGYGIEPVAVMAGIGVLIWFLHRENIKRLLTGKEQKFLKN